MMRSMFSGVTGLRNHQLKMDVIGNNIANVNTVGFKKSRVTFQDALNQTLQSASSPQGNRGGTNPMQIGLGMNIASIDTLHTSSSTEYTGNLTDLAIEGDGFFILGDGDQRYYTRAGNFGFDEEGNFVSTSTGLKVMGWRFDLNVTQPPNTSPQNIGSIVVKKGMMMPAKATSEVSFAKNLNSDDEDGTVYDIPFKVYDSKGSAHNLTIRFNKTADNTWDYSIYDQDPASPYGAGTLVFDNQGNIDTNNSEINSATLTLNGADDIEFTLDFTGVTQYAKETSIDLSSQNGYAAGTLLGVTVDTNGVITGVFDNGQNREMAQVALANFDNPQGLIKAGQNLFTYSSNSGEPQIGTSGTGGRGTISPSSLEMSNVDLSEEFTQMIITQRGFQANARIITASDEMLQELVNIKR